MQLPGGTCLKTVDLTSKVVWILRPLAQCLVTDDQSKKMIGLLGSHDSQTMNLLPLSSGHVTSTCPCKPVLSPVHLFLRQCVPVHLYCGEDETQT